MRTLGVLLVVAAVWLSGASSFACRTAGPTFLEMDPDHPVVEFQSFDVAAGPISRGRDSNDNCSYGTAWTALEFSNANPAVGFLVEVVDGEAPLGFPEHAMPVVAVGGRIGMSWDDETFSEVDLIVRVTAVAPNGDVGPFQDVRVRDEPLDEGCSSTGHHGINAFSLLLIGLFIWRRR